MSGRRRPFDHLASPVSDAPSSEEQVSAPRRIVRSFGYAFEGLETIARTQPNFWVHVCAACLALVLGVVVRLSPVELAMIVDNSFNIHQDGERLVFREDENPRAKLMVCARNDKLFSDGSDQAQLAKQIRYVIGGTDEVAKISRVIALPHPRRVGSPGYQAITPAQARSQQPAGT